MAPSPVVPLRRDPPVRSHDRVPMGRERNTGRRSEICAQRAGMIPCVPSQDLIRLIKLNDSRRLWVGNHQDSSEGRSFEKAQVPKASVIGVLLNPTVLAPRLNQTWSRTLRAQWTNKCVSSTPAANAISRLHSPPSSKLRNPSQCLPSGNRQTGLEIALSRGIESQVHLCQ
jgi:hypothetical protein